MATSQGLQQTQSCDEGRGRRQPWEGLGGAGGSGSHTSSLARPTLTPISSWRWCRCGAASSHQAAVPSRPASCVPRLLQAPCSRVSCYSPCLPERALQEKEGVGVMLSWPWEGPRPHCTGPAPSLALGSSSECLPPLTFYSVLSLVPHHHPCLSPLLHRHSLCTAVGTEPGFVMAKGLFPTVIELHYDLQLRRNTGPLPADNLRVPGVRAQASPFPPPLLRVEFFCLGCCDL